MLLFRLTPGVTPLARFRSVIRSFPRCLLSPLRTQAGQLMADYQRMCQSSSHRVARVAGGVQTPPQVQFQSLVRFSDESSSIREERGREELKRGARNRPDTSCSRVITMILPTRDPTVRDQERAALAAFLRNRLSDFGFESLVTYGTVTFCVSANRRQERKVRGS